jgi:protein gp37
VESQEQITRIDTLSRIPAAIRFVSAEPLLGPIRFGHRIQFIDWVITGCERAHKDKRRTMEDDWVRDIRDECDVASIPLFFKQYYSGTKLVFDGLIDDQRCQAWPQP